MVRVISEKLFSPPRSRHSSGETVDKELAARAVEVLSGLNSRRLEFSDYESSSDSHWDSEVEVEGDGHESLGGKELTSSEETCGVTDVLRKRKERRRERNKLSAQAYRVRRKEQCVKQQNVLVTLQDENSRLKNLVDSLEEELDRVRHSLRHRLPATAPSTATLFKPTTTAKKTTHTSKGASSLPSLSSQTYKGASSLPSLSSQTLDKQPLSFSTLAKKEQAFSQQQQPMDNDQSRRQQISPVVDNFLFSKLPRTASPSPGAMSSPKTTFSFPMSPAAGARHSLSTSSFLPATLPTISEKPDVQFGLAGQHHQQQQSSNYNANANAKMVPTTNSNTFNTNANMRSLCQNNNLMNNNKNNFLAAPVFGVTGAHTDMHSPLGSFKFSQG